MYDSQRMLYMLKYGLGWEPGTGMIYYTTNSQFIPYVASTVGGSESASRWLRALLSVPLETPLVPNYFRIMPPVLLTKLDMAKS